MVFIPSPALRRIHQLFRLIRKHPDLSAKTRNIARHRKQQSGPEFPRPKLLDLKLLDPKLPDPELFMDASTERNPISDRTDLDSRRRRASRPGRSE